MGYEAERAEELADRYLDGLLAKVAQEAFHEESSFSRPTGDLFETAKSGGGSMAGAETDEPIRLDRPGGPARPEARNGRYYLPDPDTGETASWQRVTNFLKLTEDTYHLELWKQRSVAKGVALLVMADRLSPEYLAGLDVKADKDVVAGIVKSAMEASGANKNRDEGTKLHESTELVDYAGGNINAAPERHRASMTLYRRSLAANGLTVNPELIERVTVSKRYGVAGKFDRVLLETDGNHVMTDIKTGDSIYSFDSFAAQLDAYRNGVNEHGIYDGRGYDRSIRVRDDYGLIIHLPSTRPGEIMIYRVPLAAGKVINDHNLSVREARCIKGKGEIYVAPKPVSRRSQVDADTHWIERMNAAHTYAQLVRVAGHAKGAGEWNDRLSGVARRIAVELKDVL